MDFNAIIKRAMGILTKPNDEWKVIKGESATIQDLFLKYAIFLAAIPAIAGFLGWILIGRSFLGITVRAPFGNSILWAIFSYVFSLAGVFLLGFIIDSLAPSFGSKKDLVVSMKVAVYAYTAIWVAGIFYLIPNISFLAFIGGLYSLFLLYMGIKDLKEPPQDKAVGYFAATIVIALVISVIIGMLVTLIAFGSARFWM
jgi:hypothetical protein